MKICAPVLIGRLLSFFTPEPGISRTDAYVAAALLALVAFTEGALHAPNFFKNTRCGMHLRIAAGSLIYRKVGILESLKIHYVCCSLILSLVQFLFSFISYSLSYINIKRTKEGKNWTKDKIDNNYNMYTVIAQNSETGYMF